MDYGNKYVQNMRKMIISSTNVDIMKSHHKASPILDAFRSIIINILNNHFINFNVVPRD